MPVLNKNQYFGDDILKYKYQKDWKYIPLNISAFFLTLS